MRNTVFVLTSDQGIMGVYSSLELAANAKVMGYQIEVTSPLIVEIELDSEYSFPWQKIVG